MKGMTPAEYSSWLTQHTSVNSAYAAAAEARRILTTSADAAVAKTYASSLAMAEAAVYAAAAAIDANLVALSTAYEGAYDVGPPQVMSMVPIPGSVDVSPSTPLSITFNEPMNPATILMTNCYIKRVSGGADPSLVADPYYGADAQTFNIDLTADLISGAQYYFHVDSVVADRYGNFLGMVYDSTPFTVA